MITNLIPINFNYDNNVLNVITYYLSKNNIEYTRTYLNRIIQNHLYNPSLLTVKDTLKEYGVDSIAIYKGNFSYLDIETPYICSIQEDSWSKSYYTIVTKIEGNLLHYLDPVNNIIKTINITKLESIDKGIILLMNSENKKNEPQYHRNKKKEKNKSLLLKASVFFLTAILSLVFVCVNLETIRWILILYFISSIIGLGVSLLLIWHDIDSHNPFIKEVCGNSSKKINCNAVLTSSGSTFLGISWAVWGATYFLTFFFSIVFFSPSYTLEYFWSIICIISLFYLPYSIYYQYKVIKQWCTLCLSILVIMLFNGLGSIFVLTDANSFKIDWRLILNILILGLFFLTLVYYAIPIIKTSIDSINYRKKWKKLRYNSNVFKALLDKSDNISVSAEGLGIVIGNPKAKHEIIKVCNLYCTPCSRAHPYLENIVRSNPDVRVRIIFFASGDNEDKLTLPVAHLLAIQEKYGDDFVNVALDDWYMSPSKEYDKFAEKYPISEEINRQKEKIHNMYEWCNEMKIRATPTIYIDGKEFPDGYKVSELVNFF